MGIRASWSDRREFDGAMRGGFSVGPVGDPVDGSFLDIGVMGCMRRQMHQRDLARHATSGRPAGGGVGAENITALNDAFRTAMTGGGVL